MCVSRSFTPSPLLLLSQELCEQSKVAVESLPCTEICVACNKIAGKSPYFIQPVVPVCVCVCMRACVCVCVCVLCSDRMKTLLR